VTKRDSVAWMSDSHKIEAWSADRLTDPDVAKVSGQAPWVPSILDKMSSLADLPEGWDGCGSRAIQPLSIETMLRVLRVIDSEAGPAPHMSPISGGALQIEWSHGDRDLEIATRSDGSLQYVKTQDGAEDEMEDGSLSSSDEEKLRHLMRWLIDGR